MKRKHIISLTIALAFCGLSITGLLLWVKIKPHFVEITHTIAGLVFIGFAIYHIVNNWSSIVGYTKSKKTGAVQKEFWVAAAIAGVVMVGGLTEFLEPIAEAGRVMGLAPKPKGPGKVSFDQISTNEQFNGLNFTIYVQKTKEAHEVPVSIWLSDAEGNYKESLLVSEAKEGRKVNFEGQQPNDNFILTSKSSATLPLLIHMQIGDETYAGSIDQAGISQLMGHNGKLLQAGLVQVR